MKLNEKLIPEKFVSIIEKGNNYIKCSDGALISFGTVSVGQISAGSEKRISVSLSQSYVDSNYCVLLTKKGTGGYWTYVMESVISRTTSGFVISTWNNANNTANLEGMDYYAIGKWK